MSDLNIFKSYRNRVTYLMNQARQAFYTNFIDENSTDHKRLFRATKQLLAKKEEFSFPNYQDKSKLANDIVEKARPPKVFFSFKLGGLIN